VLAASVPSRTIGGDFVHYVTLPGGAFAFALGDVAGKGPAAALLAAMLLGVLEGHAESDAAPAATLARANKAFVRRTIEAQFATMLRVLAPGGALTYSNAGHPPAAHGSGLRRLDKGG
jgi:serine phosphatase RsbU (regulator of sigma subunit)